MFFIQFLTVTLCVVVIRASTENKGLSCDLLSSKCRETSNFASSSDESQIVSTDVYAGAPAQSFSQSISNYLFNSVLTYGESIYTKLAPERKMFINFILTLLGMVFGVIKSWGWIVVDTQLFVNQYASSLAYLDKVDYYLLEAVNKYNEMNKT